MTEEVAPPEVSRHVVAFVFVTVFLDMMGVGIIIPVLPELIHAVGHMNMADAAGIGGWMEASYAGGQFLFAPLIGNLSDRFGRRPLLLLAIFGLGVDFLLQAVAPTVGWLLAARLFSGICGASWATANACVADVTPREGRARAFGILGAAMGLGFIVGPAVGGLLGMIGPRAPFWAAAAISLANFLYGWFALPETLAPDKRRAFDLWRANPLGVFRVFATYRSGLAISIVLGSMAFFISVYASIVPFWGKARFGWSEAQIGLTLTFYGLVVSLFQGFLTGPATRWLGERRAVVVGFVFSALAPLGFGLAWNMAGVMAMIVFLGPEGLLQPVLTAMATHEAPEDAQGELQGGLSAVMSVSMVLGIVFFAQIFRFFLTDAAPFQSPNVAYFVASAGIFATLMLFVWLVPRAGVRSAS